MQGFARLIMKVLLGVALFAGACEPAQESESEGNVPGSTQRRIPPLAPPLALHSVSPPSGPKAGGIRVTLTGDGFSNGSTVAIGAAEATEVIVWSGTRITATLPPWFGDWEYVPVVVRNPDASKISRSDLFAYYGTTPAFSESKSAGNFGYFYRLSSADFNGDQRDDLMEHGSLLLNNRLGGFTRSYPGIYSGGMASNADADRDGKPDVLVTYQAFGSAHLGFYKGDGSGGFAAPVSYFVSSSFYPELRGVDLNGDGKLDCAGITPNKVHSLFGDGAGGFSAPIVSNVPFIGSLYQSTDADFNNDGKMDLAAKTDDYDSWGAIAILLGDGAGSFSLAGSVAVTSRLRSFVALDWNGDGNADVMVATSDRSAATVFFGNGMGGLTSSTDLLLGTNLKMWTGDVNHDGRRDLAIANDKIRIFLNNGPSGYSLAHTFAVGTGSPLTSMTGGDFDGDGHVDLVVSRENGLLTIYAGDGTGKFDTDLVPAGESPSSFVTGDWNRDGKQDLAALDAGLSQVNVLLGDGQGGLGPLRSFAVGTQPKDLIVTDLNNDQIKDMVVMNVGSKTLTMLLGDGQGGFSAAPDVTLDKEPIHITAGDWNQDKALDFAILASDGLRAWILTLVGDGRGGMSIVRQLDIGTTPTWIGAADLNHDGKQDLVASTWRIIVLLGDGKGGFADPDPVLAYGISKGVLVDMNRDGHVDLLADTGVYLGDGKGAFPGWGGHPGVWDILGDWNGDGYPDKAFGDGITEMWLSNKVGNWDANTRVNTYGRPVASADFNGDRKDDLVLFGGGIQILFNQTK